MNAGGAQPRDLSRLFADLVEVVEPTLDAQAVARRVQALLVGSLAIDNAAVHLLDAEGDFQRGAGSLSGISQDDAKVGRAHPFGPRLADARRPLRIPVTEVPAPAVVAALQAKGVTNVVVTPFLAGERIVGMFACSRNGGRDIAEISDEMFLAIGRVVGVALEHSRLLGVASARAEADRALLDAARLATAGADMDSVLGTYAEALARSAGTPTSAIVLPEEGDRLRLAATYGTTAEEVALLNSAPIMRGDPVISRAYEARRLICIDIPATQAGHPGAKEVLERRKITRIFVLPLVARDAVLGVAMFGQESTIAPDRIPIVEAVGHEIALALQAAEERESARRRAERETLEESIRGAVRASFDLTAILQGAVEKLGHALGAARCFVGAGVAGRAVYCVTNEYRASSDLAPAIEWRFDGPDRPVARAAAKGEVVCHDIFADARFGSREAVAPSDLRSFIVESFVVGEVWRGAITVGETDRARRWTDEEVRLVRAVADHCAIAARRAELHDDARRRASELELTISQMTDGVVMCNERLEVIRANAAAQQLLWGVTPDGRGGAAVTVHDVDGRALDPEEYPIVRAVRFAEVVRDRELIFRLVADGRERIVVSSASPIHDNTGRLVGGVVVMKDVTDSRAAAAHAGRTEKLRVVGELAASVAHDINNTLAAVLGSAELVSAITTQPEVRRNADVIAQAARDASVILGRLTRLSQRSHATSAREPVDLVQVADDAIELTRPRWGRPDRRITAALDAPPGAVRIQGVASELREVLTNLILNSVDAMPDGGAIRVRVAREGEDAVVEVSDEGTGMTQDVLRHAFEPFFTTKGESGTGLGLSISSAIVAGHGGRIDAESRIGGGTKIRVWLPYISPAEPAVVHERRRVLVVDDDARVRAVLVDLLVADGYHVLSAGSGEEALAVLEREAAGVDVLVTDYLMQGMSGLVLAEAARERQPRLPIVIVSGFYGDAPPEDIERLGARVVSKPFRGEDVRAAVAAATRMTVAAE